MGIVGKKGEIYDTFFVSVFPFPHQQDEKKTITRVNIDIVIFLTIRCSRTCRICSNRVSKSLAVLARVRVVQKKGYDLEAFFCFKIYDRSLSAQWEPGRCFVVDNLS